MKIGGLQKFSLIDYPGKSCAIVFTQGCMFRCKFCHNPELVDPRKYEGLISEESFFNFLESRKGILEAVTVTGGEPAIHSDLIEFLKKIKSYGFLVKLDTTGYFPQVVKKVINEKIIDYIAMDIKAQIENYKNITQVNVRAERIRESIKLIRNSGIEYEFRTTIAKSLTSKENILKIAEEIKGSKKYFLQKFVPTKALDETILYSKIYTDEEFLEMREMVKENFEVCEIR